jgi:hypothetical protein
MGKLLAYVSGFRAAKSKSAPVSEHREGEIKSKIARIAGAKNNLCMMKFGIEVSQWLRSMVCRKEDGNFFACKHLPR